jgi:hypothetical protein
MPGKAAGYPVDIRGIGNNAQRQAVARAKTLLKSGKRFRSDTRETTWSQSEKQYSGDHWDMAKAPEGQDLIVVNMSFSTGSET